ncbi:MAG TPA: 2'-5' RNA ligase family protein, partial [Candidatus Paceibacterota bacterium]|nr:2'-5' RNA ligase family protein [Candidatus Paceibacterota bacterium]
MVKFNIVDLLSSRNKNYLTIGSMKQRQRVFIAINLPEDIKKKLTDYQEKWPELPIRWTKKDNIHITLFFLGYLNNEEIVEVCKMTKEVASRRSSFFVNLNKICYGPA